MKNKVDIYYKAVCKAYAVGNIESSYNSAIIDLLRSYGCNPQDLSGGRGGKRGENIDIKLWRKDDEPSEIEPFAGVEVKRIGGMVSDEQLKAEIERYGNVIFTDNLSWRFYHGGNSKVYTKVDLIELKGKDLVLKKNSIEMFESLMQNFMLHDAIYIKSSEKLAEYMANHARTIRDVLIDILKEDSTGLPVRSELQDSIPMFSDLIGIFDKIRAELLPSLNTREFADMYAQTIVYGLFVARYNEVDGENFNRYVAIGRLKEESALLSRFFTHIASTGNLHPTLENVIDKLCRLYSTCNISELLADEERGDTIVHFYEDFLQKYDPVQRKKKGVFYTPQPVVKYMVSMVDKLLVEEFGIENGLACNDTVTVKVKNEKGEDQELEVPSVAILDPACGTGTFHAEIIKYVKDKYFSGGKEAFWADYIQGKDSLTSRLIGFEIMMTSYVVAHLNLKRTVEETLGHKPDEFLSTNVYLTNTLASVKKGPESIREMRALRDFSAAIESEAYQADKWKARRPVKVVIGNPPYLFASVNPYDITAYRFETDGVHKLKERTSRGLSDDYVKFFRFAESIIEKNKEGIVALITNHGYVSYKNFRGMRASLLRTFDKIFIVNMNNYAEDDENIFDIQRGVSIFIGCKFTVKRDWAKVQYGEIFGNKEYKFKKLKFENIEFIDVIPDKETARFMPLESGVKDEYEAGISVYDLFNIKTSGIMSGNNELCYHRSKESLNNVINDFRFQTSENLRIKYNLSKDSKGWNLEKAKKDIIKMDGKIVPIAFRLFDFPQVLTYYTGRTGFMARARARAMTNLNGNIVDNVGLCFGSGTSLLNAWDGVFITDKILDLKLLELYPTFVAPLYVMGDVGLDVNFDRVKLNELSKNIIKKPDSQGVFDYIYGVLFDPVYRKKFEEFLRINYPRVPIINVEADKDNPDAFYVSEEMFWEYVKAGEELRNLHLMKTIIKANLDIREGLEGISDMTLAVPKYAESKLWFNKHKYIIGISKEVWEYRIGGYQVLDKWFKSHKGEIFDIGMFDHICKVVGLLGKTIEIQGRLSKLNK